MVKQLTSGDIACVQPKSKRNRKLLSAPKASKYVITAQQGLHKSTQCCPFRENYKHSSPLCLTKRNMYCFIGLSMSVLYPIGSDAPLGW